MCQVNTSKNITAAAAANQQQLKQKIFSMYLATCQPWCSGNIQTFSGRPKDTDSQLISLIRPIGGDGPSLGTTLPPPPPDTLRSLSVGRVERQTRSSQQGVCVYVCTYVCCMTQSTTNWTAICSPSKRVCQESAEQRGGGGGKTLAIH